MQPFQERVINELADLNEKLKSLSAFLKTDELSLLPKP